ncbi:hypothetical protein IPA_02955 [Ignicoccus pacificus DSM 13166]|uniref:Transmembrane protein n=1 Tax=Ignicoccus pacificus DSM 13166 TaxID=940294 RepID=A0A977KAV2_9CREN|nr:hypothetical protein IPA_02955 [Ignicoccus pacificus DSM 13166]
MGQQYTFKRARCALERGKGIAARRGGAELLGALMLLAIVLGLSTSYLLPMFHSVQQLSDTVSKYLMMLDIWERISELFVGVTSNAPSFICTNLTTALSCTFQLPYFGKAGEVVPEAVYLLDKGVASCVAPSISVNFTTVSVASTYLTMVITAYFPSCTVTTNYGKFVIAFALPEVVSTSSTTVTLTLTSSTYVTTITTQVPLMVFYDRNPVYYYSMTGVIG